MTDSTAPYVGPSLASTDPGRPGIKTTEFWLAVGCMLLSAYLASKGKDELAAVIASIATGSYTGARAYTKRPRQVS